MFPTNVCLRRDCKVGKKKKSDEQNSQATYQFVKYAGNKV